MIEIMIQIKRGYIVVFFALILMNVTGSNLFSQNDRQHIRAGNRDYRAGDFGDSELEYRRATEVAKGTTDAWFNLGNSIYRQQRFDDAASSFRKNASISDNPIKKANSYYNLGNSLLSSEKIEESIEAYKNSLRLNPDNKEAKFNLAYAQDLLREQEQKQDQNQDEEDNQDDSEGKQDKEQNKDQDQNQPESDDQKGQDQNKKDNQQDGSDQQSAISEEDARRLLEALAENEKELQEKVKKDKAAAAMIRTLKNW
jgi:tetratricopeptide (TPR) repeat protein